MRLLLFGFILIFGLSACKNANVATQFKEKPPNILFLIADDWSFPHAGIYNDPVLYTPTFDYLATQGALFNHAYCAAPSCSPSRAAILTGRYPHQLESAGNLWPVFPDKFPNWVSILAQSGYHTGSWRKGWGPGNFQRGGYKHNPAGKSYESFDDFLSARKDDSQAFCFWFGSSDPHRAYEANLGIKTGMNLADVIVPGFLLDTPCTRNDLLDYYFEVERFDRECGQIIEKIRKLGELDNTLIIMTSDNGMPFPRAKANLYDYGTRMPLAIFWQGKIWPGTVINDFVNSIDFAPFILNACGLPNENDFAGLDLMPLLQGQKQEGRTQVFLERERHANVRKGNLSYPSRAIRNEEYLYIRNFEPDRWPAGDPKTHQSLGQYGDVDNSISKFLIMQDSTTELFQLNFGKRPAEELYHVKKDPYNLNNLADESAVEEVLAKFRVALQGWMTQSSDLRAKNPQTIYWDTVAYMPKYQFEDFDLNASIEAYQRLSRKSWGNFEAVSCQ